MTAVLPLVLLLTLLPQSIDSFLIGSNALSRTRFATLKTRMSPSSKSTSAGRRRLYPFEEARKIARGHGFETQKEFLEYECAGAYQLPKNPDQVWSQEWKGWDDFLGTPLPFDEARQVSRLLRLSSKKEYLKLIESKTINDDELASRLPYRPDLRYKQEWCGWEDWLRNV